jgi:hypothetical protein
MDIGNFNFLNNNKDKSDNLINKFLKSLQEAVQDFSNFNNSKPLNNISENSIYVITDINDKKLSLTDIGNGEEIEISVSFTVSNQNTYNMQKEDFCHLDLGRFLTIKNNYINILNDSIEIENKSVAAKLKDMYFCIEQEKDAVFSVTEISEDKIFLTNTQEGGHFSILKEIYPDFKIGDLLKKVDGKYILIS